MEQNNNDSGFKIGSLEKMIAYLEKELHSEVAKQRAGLKYGMEKGRAVFEQEILRRHREIKVGLWTYVKSASFLVILTAPIIYSGIFFILALDLFVTVYQHTCFRIYKIPLVKRNEYLVFERTHLAYLNIIQMFNCAYCSYGNGIIAYAREIFARTEQHWCPIKHAKKVVGYHDHYDQFAEFGDAEEFIKKYMADRNEKTDTLAK